MKQRYIFEEITSDLKNTYLYSADNVSIVIEKLEGACCAVCMEALPGMSGIRALAECS